MSQLLIVDVQQIFQISKNLDRSILKASKKFSHVVYCYDIVSGEGVFPYDMWEDMAKAFETGKFSPTVITKEYAFFREMMDTHENDDFLIALGKLMMANKISDARDISDHEAYEKFNDLYDSFSVYPDFESECFYIPQDLVEQFRKYIKSGVTVVGGGVNECLKEVCLLLDILEIKYAVDKELTY